MLFKIQRIKNRGVFFLLLAFCATILSCKYYKIEQSHTNGVDYIDHNNKGTNYYVLHVGNAAWQIWNFSMSNSESMTPYISGVLTEFDSTASALYEYMKKNNAGGNGVKRIYPENVQYVYQIHIYADSYVKNGQSVRVDESSISRVEIYDINKGLVVAQGVGIFLLAVGGFIGGVCLSFACPHVYVYNGETYYFNNTIFAGATSEVLERHDYKIMPDYFPNSETYQFIVKNEEPENQFTNLLELMVIQHDKDIEVIPDQEGLLYSISDPKMPSSIQDNNGSDLIEIIGYDDDRAFAFNNDSEEPLSSIYAVFEKPQNISESKLVLSVKNTEWFGYVYYHFASLFGDRYDDWVKKNGSKTKEEIESSLKKQGILLSVSIKQDDAWVELDFVDLIGYISYNHLVIPIDPKILTNDKIEIKVSSGFLFWQLDYLAMDFSAKRDFEVQYLSPDKATGNGTIDFKNELSFDDDQYMNHPKTGDSTYVAYTGLKNDANQKRTIVLHSKGYYLPQYEIVGKMQKSELAKFKNEGQMSVYSRELYDYQLGTFSLKNK